MAGNISKHKRPLTFNDIGCIIIADFWRKGVFLCQEWDLWDREAVQADLAVMADHMAAHTEDLMEGLMALADHMAAHTEDLMALAAQWGQWVDLWDRWGVAR